ncbi:MSP domain-containing protein, partial [Trichostrongylus colubriformis]
VSGNNWESSLNLQNTSQCGILFKVKCTSNARIEIDDCADILLPGNEVQVPFRRKGDACGNDELMVLYCLVGKQWLDESSSAFRCWERVKKQGVSIKRKIVKIIQKP